MDSPLIPIIENDGLRVSSRVVAQFCEVQHDSLMALISEHREIAEANFGVYRFEIGKPLPGSVGGRPAMDCLLTEDQATFVITLVRNSAPVVYFKAQLVKAFREALDARSVAALPAAEITDAERDADMVRIVHSAEVALEAGKVPLARAQALFTGAKVYQSLRLLASESALALGMPPDAAANGDAERLLQTAAGRLEEDGSFTAAELLTMAKSLRLFAGLEGASGFSTLGRALQPCVGRLLRDPRGRVFSVGYHRTRQARRYAIDFEQGKEALV